MEHAPLPRHPQSRSETCTIEDAAARLGISRSKAYELARTEGSLGNGIPILRFGRKMAVPVPALDRALGYEPTLLPDQIAI